MDFLKFLMTRVFLKNLLIAIGAAMVLILGSLIWLRIYTHHGQALTVPDLTGLSPEEVQVVVTAKKLRYMVTDSVFFRELPKGTVVKQNPESGSRVKELRTIYITLNAVNPERISMPTVTGVSLRQARAILETYGLNLGKISYKPDIAVNNVLQQMFNGKVIEPGEMIIKGSAVNLVLGKGLSDETTLVPSLIGKDIRTAKNLLADRYLNIGATVYDNSVSTGEDTLFSFIWRQEPGMEEESRLQMGSEIDIWLTTDSTRLPQPDSLNVDQIQILDDPNF
jgi:eukaryotic-like serine/threonine-protein kinase